MFIDSQVFRYGLTVLGIFAGAVRLRHWFGPAFDHAATSYALDLCSLTHQYVCF